MGVYNCSSKPISNCQICFEKLSSQIIFLGYMPPVNSMLEIGSETVEQPAFPLELMRCDNCGHVQINLEIDAEVLFPYSYPYLSGSTNILHKNFKELADECSNILNIEKSDRVVDIGSNDGTLLRYFKEEGFDVLGIEPSQAGQIARKNGIRTFIKYFSMDTANEVLNEFGKVKIVTAANVFAHIKDPHEVVRATQSILTEDGIFVSESHYLGSLIETLQYDTIYHEHLRYYHLNALIRLFETHGLEVFRVKKIPSHGGSIRVYAAQKNSRKIEGNVNKILNYEEESGLIDGTILKKFRRDVVKSKIELYSLLSPIIRSDARIFGVGAPSRASTLINYVGIDDGILECVVEISSSHKLNKYIPGTKIPVLDEMILFEQQPEYVLLLSWHIADELIANLKRKGYEGKFIVPLPTPMVID